MAVTIVRTGVPFPGKQGEALDFVEKRAAFIKENYGIDSVVHVRVGGDIGEISMVSHPASLAEFEEKKREIIRATKAGDFPVAPEGVFQTAEEQIWLSKED